MVLLTTAGSQREARLLAQMILKHRLAACVNLIGQIESWYWWKKKLQRSPETLLVIKTSRAHIKELASLIKAHHSYEVPELVALSISWGDSKYLGWLWSNLKRSP